MGKLLRNMSWPFVWSWIVCLCQVVRAAEPPITAIAFEPQGTSVLAGSQAGLKQYAWPALKETKSLPTKLEQIHGLAFSPDGKTLAAAGGTPGEDGILELWTWPAFEKLKTLSLHSDLVYAVAWSADSQTIFTAGHDGDALKVSASSGKIERRFTGHSQPVRALGLLPDQQTLVSAGHDHTLRVWDAQSGNLIRSLNNHTKPVRDLAVRPAGDDKALPMIASVGTDRTIRLWQPTIGRMVRFLRLESAVPLAAAWSPDGRFLFVADDAGQVRIIEPDTLTVRSTIESTIRTPYCLLANPDGTQLLIGGAGGTLQRINVKTSAALRLCVGESVGSIMR